MEVSWQNQSIYFLEYSFLFESCSCNWVTVIDCVWLYQCPGRNRSWVCFDLGQCRRQAERPIWVKSSLPSDRCNSCAKYKNHEIQQFQTNPVSWVGVGDIHFSCNACDVLTMQCFGILNDGIFYRFLFNSKRCDLLSKFKKSKISCKYKVPSTKW